VIVWFLSGEFRDSLLERPTPAAEGIMVGIELRCDYGADDLRALARISRDAKQARRLMALAGVADGVSRTDAAAIGLMDRQTLRDWVHRFNEQGPDGLLDRKSTGPKPKLTADQRTTLMEIVTAGPDPEIDGVVRWRCGDLAAVIKARFGVGYHESSIGKLLRSLGFSHVSARPRHPKQDPKMIETFKKTSRKSWRKA
jgi:transposase